MTTSINFLKMKDVFTLTIEGRNYSSGKNQKNIYIVEGDNGERFMIGNSQPLTDVPITVETYGTQYSGDYSQCAIITKTTCKVFVSQKRHDDSADEKALLNEYTF